MVSKGIDQFSGARINGIQGTCGSHKDAAVRAIFTLPVITTSLAGNAAEHAKAGRKLVNPEFLACRSVECDKRTLFRRYIGNVIHYQRTECVITLISSRIAPGDIELTHVLHVDLLEWRVM